MGFTSITGLLSQQKLATEQTRGPGKILEITSH